MVEPTETTAGTIAKVCPKCNDRQEVEVAALTDASVWSVTEVLSTCQKAGSRTYVSEYGTVVVELPKEEHVYGEWTLLQNQLKQQQVAQQELVSMVKLIQ